MSLETGNWNLQAVELGRASFRGDERRIVLGLADRLHHAYLLGKTGTGKTTVLTTLMLQDIAAGRGCCFVDPHGDAVHWLLERIPSERAEDVILFDPADAEYPLGLNLLEAHTPEERDFLVSEAIAIFYKLFDPNREGLIGPQFEHWMRNGALTVMAHPEGGTLLDIPRLFTDATFERAARQHLRDRVVAAFWDQQMARTSDFHRSEMLNYFTSKFGRFEANALMRNIVGQRASAIRWADALERKAIVLIRLSKGVIGELNASMLGLILMTKLAAAILARAAVPTEQRHPFFLYVDEFQNVLSDAFLSLLAEARKYGLSVTLAHQYLNQLPEDIRGAILGNVRTIIAFQLGAEDTGLLLRELDPERDHGSARLDAETLQTLPPHEFVVRLTYRGQTYPSFRGRTVRPEVPPSGIPSADARDIVRLRYGTPRALVETELRERLQTAGTTAQ